MPSPETDAWLQVRLVPPDRAQLFSAHAFIKHVQKFRQDSKGNSVDRFIRSSATTK